jgi:hypothetical protein
MREIISQYTDRSGRLSNLMVEYESTNHLDPFRVNGTKCIARSSTGEMVTAFPFRQTIFCTVGQMSGLLDCGVKLMGLAVAMASLVLLSKITSKGAKVCSRDTSVQDLRSARCQCMACDGFCLLSTSWPRRTASEEKSTFCKRQH